MPRKAEMSWEPKPAFRWTRMYEGVRYRVTCKELGAMVWTEEGSVKLANEWWRKKLAQLEGPTRTESLLAEVAAVTPAEMTRVIEQAQIYRRVLAEGGRIDAGDMEQADRIIGVGPLDDDLREDFLGKVVQKVKPAAASKDRTLKHNAEAWLDVIRGPGKIEPTSFREIKEFIRWFYALPLAGRDADVGVIDGPKVQEFYLHLSACPLADSTKKKRWSFFRRFVQHLWGLGLIELPRNLQTFKFTVDAQAIKTYKTEDVRNLLASLKPRLRLYALLAVNCSMNAVDVGKLRKDQVDLDAATLTRKRSKTKKKKRVPVVVYKLWPETVALLRRLQSGHEELMLTSKANTPLWTSTQAGEKSVKKDLIANQWRKKPLPIPFSAFRSIGATLIKSHRVHGQVSRYYLGHSPQTVEDRHYSAPPDQLLGEALDWLRTEILGIG